MPEQGEASNEPRRAETKYSGAGDDVSNTHNDSQGSGINSISDTTSSVRHAIGQSMTTIAETANDNLIAVRYAAGSAVLLLGLYSISQTPLFFRYKSVLAFPSSTFSNRRTLTCRLSHVEKQQQPGIETATPELLPNGEPLVVHVRHLSPMGRLLSKQLLDFTLEHSPSSIQKNKDASHSTDDTLLCVQLYGLVQQPQHTSQFAYLNTTRQKDDLLASLARDNALVRCQFLSLLSPAPDDSSPPTAIARLYYWQRRDSSLLWFLPKKVDLQATLVQNGEARLTNYDDSSTENESSQQKNILHASESVKHKHGDVQYLDQLALLEREAIQHRCGMWQDAALRDNYRDVVQEAEWEASASWWQRLWRRFRA
jgi:hypothetical protein